MLHGKIIEVGSNVEYQFILFVPSNQNQMQWMVLYRSVISQCNLTIWFANCLIWNSIVNMFMRDVLISLTQKKHLDSCSGLPHSSYTIRFCVIKKYRTFWLHQILCNQKVSFKKDLQSWSSYCLQSQDESKNWRCPVWMSARDIQDSYRFDIFNDQH